ncbi:Autophagy-related protein 13a, partial [Bienertia sinuspersici]
IPSLKPQDHSGDLQLNSKAKKTDKWFNLALGERPASLEKLQFWHRNLMDPMVIDVIVIRRDSSGNDLYYEQMFDGGAVETVIERWVVQYENHKTMPVQTSDISLLYKKMYQRSIILFRCLCSMMRHLPAYRIFKQLSSLSQPSDIDLIYKVSSFRDPFSREEEKMMEHYSFNPVEAVNGRLCASVTYRANLSEFSLESSTAFPPVIIADYVGSPAIDPMRAFPSIEKVSNPVSFSSRGTRNANSMPNQRPHSWSSGIHKGAANMQNYPLNGSPPVHRGSFAPIDDLSSPTYIQGQRIQQYRMLGGHQKTNSYDETLSPPFSPSSSPSSPAYLLRQSSTQSRLRPESAPVAIPHPMLNRSPRYLSPNCLTQGVQKVRCITAWGVVFWDDKSLVSRDSKDESGRFSGLLSSGSSPHKAFSRSSSRLSYQDELDVCDFSCPFDVDDVDTSDSQARYCFLSLLPWCLAISMETLKLNFSMDLYAINNSSCHSLTKD